MIALKSNTIFYSFKCDGTLISYKLKSAGIFLNLVGASDFFEIPFSHIHHYSIESTGPYYVFNLKVNSFKLSSEDSKLKHMRFFFLKSLFDEDQYQQLVQLLEKQTSYDIWQQSFNNKIRVAEG